jgi:hypothetical protein
MGKQEVPLFNNNNKKQIQNRIKFVVLVAVFLCFGLGRAVADVVYCNPRPFNVTYIFELEPDPNNIDRSKDLKLWLPIPREWDSQKAVQIISIDPPPDGTYEDPDFGNRMAFWDFGKGPEKKIYMAIIKYRLESYDIKVDVYPNKVGTYEKSSEEYKLYTRSEHTICLTPKIYELAKEAVGDEKNPYLQARRIAQYAYKKVHYKDIEYDRGRGIQCLLDYPVKDPNTGEEYYEGACTQRSAMVVALCRAVGIPARCVSGYRGWPPRSELKLLYANGIKLNPQGLAAVQDFGQLGGHTWTEFYIPNYGWIPDDYIRTTPFNCRVIHFKGRDIKVGPQCPEGESGGYGSDWVLMNDSRADLLGAVWNIAKIHTARLKSIFEFDPFPADALVLYRERLDQESKRKGTLQNWRSSVLDELDFDTRGVTNQNETLTAEFKNRHLLEQRGAFVCHVLRNILGNDRFSQIVEQYERMRVSSGKAVPTAQFQKIAETVYGQSLRWFFEPWMDETQLPQFKLDQINLVKDGDGWHVSGHLLQTGKLFYQLPVELAVHTEKELNKQTIWQEKPDTEFQFHTSQKPIKLIADPNREILKIQRNTPNLSWQWNVYPDSIIIYGTISETQANKAAAERFDYNYLGLGSKLIKKDTDVNEADMKTKCIFLIGRPETNRITQKYKDIFPIKLDGNKFIWQGTTYDKPMQGVAQIAENPNDARGLIIMFAGLSPEATQKFPDLFLYDADASYVIFEGDKQLVSGDWEDFDNDLVWKFSKEKTED